MDRRIKRALELMQWDISRAGGAARLARLLGLSPSRFGHLFKLETGFDFRAMRCELALIEAVRLLADRELSIKEVAWRCGYSSLPSFTRLFKQRTGKAPGEYRRSHSG